MHWRFSFAAQAVRLSSTRKKPTCDLNCVTSTANATPPELLSPAGDFDCARAAVENGADAVYFGLRVGLNARSKAKNFALEELPEFMDYLHLRGVLGFVTLNTLVFPSELDLLEKSVRAVVSAGIDAAIVQDVGAARLIRAIAPDFPHSCVDADVDHQQRRSGDSCPTGNLAASCSPASFLLRTFDGFARKHAPLPPGEGQGVREARVTIANNLSLQPSPWGREARWNWKSSSTGRFA